MIFPLVKSYRLMYIGGRDFVTFAKFRFSEYKSIVTCCIFSVTFMEVDMFVFRLKFQDGFIFTESFEFGKPALFFDHIQELRVRYSTTHGEIVDFTFTTHLGG